MRLDHLLSKEEVEYVEVRAIKIASDWARTWQTFPWSEAPAEISAVCFIIQSSRAERFPVAIRAGETPVPIPNTTVKTCAADGTALETVWQSRRLPEFKKVKTHTSFYI